MPLISRSTTRQDRFVGYKMALLGIGLAFLLVGIRLEESWPVWVAMGFVGVAFVLRFLPGSTEHVEREANSEEPKEPDR